MKHLNIKDIAKIAGVGVTTVSRVINGHSDVKEETRKHVLEIIEKHNYIPNNSARNLKRQDTNHIGILIKGMYNPFFARMVQIIEKILAASNYTTIVHYNMDDGRDIDSAHEFIMEKKLKGIICLGGDFDNLIDDEILRLKVPVVFTSTQVPLTLDTKLYSSVAIDNRKAAFSAVEKLCLNGHKRIGIISSGEDDKSVGTIRTEGYIDALRQYKLVKQDRYFEVGAYTFESGYDGMVRLLEKASDITAVFAISDVMAIGAAKAIFESGRRVPEDIAIIGFDDIDYAAFFNPPLSTVRQPVEEIASRTAELIVNMLDDEAYYEHVLFDTELIIRKSC